MLSIQLLAARWRQLSALVLMPVLVAACGGGGGGSSDVKDPVVSFTSHSDGDAITGGDRSVTFTWTVDQAQTVTLTHNGAPVAVNAAGGGSYSADLTLANQANTLTITARTAAGGNTVKSLTLNYPVLAFANGQAASVAIGQPDLDSNGLNQGGSAAANTLHYPYGNPAFHDGVLYVTDTDNNRVLAFDGIPAAHNASASFVLGQDSLTTTTNGTAADQLRRPIGALVDAGRLLVSDQGNHRVLVWNTAPKSRVAADLVIGQTDFGLGSFTCAQNRLASPQQLLVVGDKLIIADEGNHRVLIWNSFPTTNGQNADLVLGQADFTSCGVNRGGSVGAGTMNTPNGVWSDGVRLFVSDYSNNRILVWDTFPTTNGQEADWALGQPDLTTTTPGTSASTLRNPWQLLFSGNQFYVVDNYNNRLLIWDSLPTSNTPADRVLGQADFDSNVYAVGPANQAYTAGVYVHENKLLVVDDDNHRVIAYEAP